MRWVQLCSSLSILWHCLSLGLEWNWPFPVLWPLLCFPNLLAYWVQHFHSIIFQDLKHLNNRILRKINEWLYLICSLIIRMMPFLEILKCKINVCFVSKNFKYLELHKTYTSCSFHVLAWATLSSKVSNHHCSILFQPTFSHLSKLYLKLCFPDVFYWPVI